ncbi:MAG: PilZ domain-containing protein [Endomicrobiales bacterium]
MTFKGEERRKHIRIFLPEGQVRLVSGILVVLVGKVVNLSLGGIMFKCSAEFNLGDELELEVTLPNGLKFKATASITHKEMMAGKSDELIYGAQFLGLGANEKLELGEYVMRKRAEQDNLLHGELE